MAQINITTTTNSITVDYGDYFEDSGTPYASREVRANKETFSKKDIHRVWITPNDVFVKLKEVSAFRIGVTQTSNNFKIGTIDGVTPSTNEELFAALSALMS
jgi:hypothetical protein